MRIKSNHSPQTDISHTNNPPENLLSRTWKNLLSKIDLFNPFKIADLNKLEIFTESERSVKYPTLPVSHKSKEIEKESVAIRSLAEEAPAIVKAENREVSFRSQEAPAKLESHKNAEPKAREGADLKTAQGPKAELVAARSNASLTSAIARAPTAFFDNLISVDGVPASEEQFRAIITCFEDCLEDPAISLDDKDHCKFLNGLIGLMHKGFSVEVGGAGSFHGKENWDASWNKLGNEKEGANFNFGVGNQHNESVKHSFKEMLTYYKNNTATHFSTERHEGGRVLAGVQVSCTVGQLINDYVFERGFPEDIRNVLAEKMKKTGLINQAVGHDKINTIKDEMRANPLLAEVLNSTILSEITNGLNVEKHAEEMKTWITAELTKCDPENKLTDVETTELVDRLLKNFLNQVENLPIQALMSGERGRLPFNRKFSGLDSLGKDLAGSTGNKHSIAIAPNRAHDKISDEWTQETLGKEDPQIQKFYEAIDTNGGNILKHGGSPLVPLRLGRGLDNNFLHILNPNKLFKAAVNRLTEEIKSSEAVASESKINALENLAKNTETEEFKQDYENIVGALNITFNKSTRQKLPLKKFANMDSVASIMYKNDVRTICSISGTTVDISLATVSVMGEEATRDLLQPLLDHLEGEKESPLTTEQGKKFREFASSIAFFMQTGQYHTAAEVLGGLFIAARTLSSKEKNHIDIDQTYQMFTQLIQEFSASPETFFAVPDEDKERINAGLKRFSEKQSGAELQRIRTHINQTQRLPKI